MREYKPREREREREECSRSVSRKRLSEAILVNPSLNHPTNIHARPEEGGRNGEGGRRAAALEEIVVQEELVRWAPTAKQSS